MNLKVLRFATLLLAALAMGMHLAHAFELPPKLQWGPELYLAVQTSLYPVFGTIGPVLEIGALLCAGVLAFQLRGRPAFPFTLTSALAIVAALAVWLIFVLPANMHINAWAAAPQSVPTDWAQWRDQWQFAQAATFGLHLVGFSALLYSSIQET